MNTEAIKNAVAQAAAQCGADSYEIVIDTAERASAEAMNKEISSVSYSRSSTMQVRCVVAGKSGYAVSELVTPEAAADAVAQAVSNAAVADDLDEMPLFEGSEHYQEVHDEVPQLPSADEMKKHAMELQEKTYAASEKIVDGSQCQVSGMKHAQALINSAGRDLSYEFGVVYRIVNAAVKDSKTDGEGNVTEDASDDYSISDIAKETADESVGKAVGNALNSLWADTVDSGKYNIIIDAATMRSLMETYASVFSARSAYMKTSLFAGKEGQKVASEQVTLVDDPFHPDKFGHCPFDGEGVATYTKKVIDAGVLNTLLYNRMYAKLMGRETTGNARDAKTIAPTGLYLAAGEYSEEALIEKLGNGIYVTGLDGLHAGANIQSGDFSLKASGFLVENGKKTRPVKNFTIADNFFSMLKKVEALSDKVKFDLTSDMGSPDVLFTDVSVSGK